jgi:hypothetical protein
VAGAEVADQRQGLPGVGDVIGDQHPGPGQVDDVQGGRQHDRQVEPLVHAGVELHVHHEQVLDVERVAERPAQEQPTPGDGQDEVGLEAVGRHLLGQLPGRGAEGLVGQDLALVAHARRWCQGCTPWAAAGTACRLGP